MPRHLDINLDTLGGAMFQDSILRKLTANVQDAMLISYILVHAGNFHPGQHRIVFHHD